MAQELAQTADTNAARAPRRMTLRRWRREVYTAAAHAQTLDNAAEEWRRRHPALGVTSRADLLSGNAHATHGGVALPCLDAVSAQTRLTPVKEQRLRHLSRAFSIWSERAARRADLHMFARVWQLAAALAALRAWHAAVLTWTQLSKTADSVAARQRWSTLMRTTRAWSSASAAAALVQDGDTWCRSHACATCLTRWRSQAAAARAATHEPRAREARSQRLRAAFTWWVLRGRLAGSAAATGEQAVLCSAWDAWQRHHSRRAMESALYARADVYCRAMRMVGAICAFKRIPLLAARFLPISWNSPRVSTPGRWSPRVSF
eukprot:6205096-Pleurochrysis_carterae.AAC.2